jgi:hypothetical protein
VIEQRRTQRFQLRLPLCIQRSGASTVSAAGETVNVSSRGVLFTSDRRLEVGESVEYTISFPPVAGSVESTELHCLGKVLRYEGSVSDPERSAKLYVMAATLERHEFVRM